VLYYGDRRARVCPIRSLERVARSLAHVAPPGEHHAATVAALVDAGLLAQGLADAAFEAHGADVPDRAADRALALCLALGRRVAASWDARHRGDDEEARAAVRALEAVALPPQVEEVVPEGYADYAVYPECYLAAARSLGRGDWTVVGIRSIGTSLGAIVAAALETTRLETVRPVGPPYERHLRLSDALRARLLAVPAARFAVVDEGPGASGSSFLSVVRELERAGVAHERIHLFPSHPGAPGPAAGEESRRRWAAARRVVRTFDDLALGPERPLLPLVTAAIPGATGPVEDLSAGRWRRVAMPGEWPPVFAQQERRKLLVPTPAGPWVAEFAGLGPLGEVRFARARVLAEAGVAPQVGALCNGFLVRPWLEAEPLTLAEARRELRQGSLLPALARYLCVRARALPAVDGAAPAERLAAMLRTNAVEALGADAGEGAERAASLLPGVAAELRPMAVDGKLEVWEWLRTPAGELLKGDAFQHADGHDLVGAQDVAWDLAGARVELELGDEELRELVRRVELGIGGRVPPASLAFHEAAYAALRLGRWSFALGLEADPVERARIEAALARYRAALRRALARG
jgi:hypothetical protein